MVGIFVVLHSTTEHEYSVNDTLQTAVNTTTVTNAAVLCPVHSLYTTLLVITGNRFPSGGLCTEH